MVRFLVVLLTCMLLLSGCAATAPPLEWQDSSVDLVWPQPPDQPRVRFLRSLTGADEFRDKNRTSKMMDWFFGERRDELPLHTPFAVAASDSGDVWVADNGTSMLYQLDLDRRQVNTFREFSAIDLQSPSGVLVDDERQRIFLADAGHTKIFVLDLDGEYQQSWAPAEGFGRPAGMAMDASGRLLVADVQKGVVFRFNADGSLDRRYSSGVNPGGRFRTPLAVAVGPAGEILVLDTLAFRVEVLSEQGDLIRTIGQLGDAAGSLARPKGLAVDTHGHIFVSDSAFDNIQVFDMTGNLLMYWGGAGSGAGQFNLPAGLFIDHQGRLLVADSYNHRVQAFQLLQ